MYLYTWKIGMCQIKLLIRKVQKLTPPKNKETNKENENRLNKNFSTSGKFLIRSLFIVRIEEKFARSPGWAVGL